MRKVDMRSDTVTLPTPAMREAMARAELGDDVFGEDPTVNRLEEMAAAVTGKEAALLVVSGTMANMVCDLVHCSRGDEIILGDMAHRFHFEQAGAAALAGVQARTVPNRPDGSIDPEQIEAAVRADNIHLPRTRLIVLENTHNLCSGHPLDAAYMAEVGKVARRHGLKIHVDGARIFNAAVALGTPVRELVAEADSVCFCLSKALGAPVGSVLCGTAAFIAKARRARKVLGGGMRQAGIIAAAGIVALDQMVERLAEDHTNARRLAEGLAALDGVGLDPGMIKTNIIFFDIAPERGSAAELAERLGRRGVLVLPMGPQRLRAVTNHHIDGNDIEYALEVFAAELAP
jgi:threonine aldolase